VRRRIKKSEVVVAKNYLNKEELEILNRIVTAYLEMAELQAYSRQPMYMKDWIARLDMFLTMTGRDLLVDAGKISHAQAQEKAELEFARHQQGVFGQVTAVEKHFIEAEKEIRSLSDKLKNRDS
jgi:hypothetical protein